MENKNVSNRKFWDKEARLKALGKGMNSPFKMKNPCWKGYEMVGTKEKDGKEVPNCVPKKK